MDSSALSGVYDSRYNNSRHAKLKQFTLEHDLVIINEGEQNTFDWVVGKSVRCNTNIPRLARRLKGWTAGKELNYWDHKTIGF